MRFIEKARYKAAEFRIDVEDLIKQINLQAKLDEWYDQLNNLLECMKYAGHQAKQQSLNILLIHYKVMYIWTRVCTTMSEMATDSYHAEFDELVRNAEQLVQPSLALTTHLPLSFEMQFLAPVYYAALKCRHFAIRRRALKMLQLAPRWDGMWNAHWAYVTAKRIIQLEESHINEQGLPDETSRIHGLPLPHEESLAHPGTVEAEFHTKPFGLSGEWRVVTEYIKL